MPLGNPIRKQNESRMVSVLATEGQTVFTVQGGYIINHISVFRNGVRLSNSEDFTAGDGSSVTLNDAANVDDRIEFHVFDRFTVQNAIVSAASTQTISGDVVVNGKIFGNLDVPSINTGIITANGNINANGNIVGDNSTNISGISSVTATSFFGSGANLTGIDATSIKDSGGTVRAQANTSGIVVTGVSTFTGLTKLQDHLKLVDDKNIYLGDGADLEIRVGSNNDGVINQSTGDLKFQRAGSGKFTIKSTGTHFSDDVSVVDKIIHEGDTDTAIRFPSANTVTVETAGSERLRISASGHMGLGISPSDVDSIGRALNIASSTGGAIYLQDTDDPTVKFGAISYNGATAALQIHAHHASSYIDLGTNGTERVRINSTGQLLLGHTASIGFGRNFETSSTSGYGGIQINRFSADTGSGGLDFVKSRNASLGGNTIVQADDNLGAITWRGADGTDFTTPAAQIKVAIDGTPGSNDMPGRIMFYTTADGASSVSERLRIDSSGQMGLGMTPTRMFEVKDSTGANRIANIRGTGASGAYLAFLDQNTTDDSKCRVGSAGGNNLVMRGDTVQFGTGAGSEFARFDSSGRLLLGTTSVGSASAYYDNLIISNTTSAEGSGITLFAATNGFNAIDFADTAAVGRGRITYGHDSDRMMIDVGGNERVRITSSGDFGIGTTSPDRKLDVSGTGNVYGKFQSTDSTGAGIEVKDTSENWLIQADGASANSLAFYDLANTSYRVHMKSNGNVEIVNGNLHVASGHGIDFSATGDGTTMSSELLDDYEEGNMNLTLTGSNGGSISYDYRTGHYTKIGNICHVTGDIRTTSNWSGTTGNLYLDLPFTSETTGGCVGAGIVSEWNLNSSAYDNVMIKVDNNESIARFTYHDGSNNNTGSFQTNNFSNGRYLKFAFTYHTQ